MASASPTASLATAYSRRDAGDRIAHVQRDWQMLYLLCGVIQELRTSGDTLKGDHHLFFDDRRHVRCVLASIWWTIGGEFIPSAKRRHLPTQHEPRTANHTHSPCVQPQLAHDSPLIIIGH